MADATMTRDGERSVSELVKDLSEQSAALARKEVELAKAEMAVKAKQIGIGAGAFGAAGIIGLFAVGALTATFILLLATAMTAWLAALIVTVVYAAVAGAAALVGKSRVQAGSPPVPERAVETSKGDVDHVKRSVQEARS
jgi:hypothetical protein